MTVLDRLRAELPRWLAALVLLTPVAALYLAHYTLPYSGPGSGSGQITLPTGFLFIDMPSYMSNAREHFEPAGFRLVYANPAHPTYDGPGLYFQPQTLLLGALWRLTGWDIAVVMLVFHLVAGVAMVRVALALYETLVGLRSAGERIGAVLFIWGGGVLVLSGLVLSWWQGIDPVANNGAGLLQLDPENGWWFLNLGRNLVFPTETYYHALFLGSALLLVRGRYGWATVLAAVLAASQPFSGVQWLMIVAAWGCLERFWLGARVVPRWLGPAGGALLVLALGYYLVFLPSFPSHRELLHNWEVPWLYQAEAFVPALLLVLLPALIRVRSARVAAATLAARPNRLLLVWAAVIFVTANHGFAIDPLVELHFVRGYDWAALFLLGAPALTGGLDWLLQRRRPAARLAGAGAVTLVVAVFLSDNVAWLSLRPWQESTRVSADQMALFAFLSQPEQQGRVVLSQDAYAGFLLIAYTPLHAWSSQAFNTPGYPQRNAELAAFFQRGEVLEAWRSLPLLVVAFRGTVLQGEAATLAVPIYSNDTYTVYRLDLPPAPS